MMLQQTPTLRPFVGKFVSLFVVARWTCQHYKAHIISRDIGSRSATYRKRMLNMKDVLAVALFKLGVTTGSVVAATFLPFQLLLDLFRGMCPFYLPFFCSISLRVYPQQQFIALPPCAPLFCMARSILIRIRQYFNMVGFSIPSFIFHSLLVVGSTINFPTLPYFFGVCLTVATRIFFALFPMLCCIIAASQSAALHTLRTHSRGPVRSHLEEFQCCREYLFAFSTSFESIWYRGNRQWFNFCAFSAYSSQSIFFAFVTSKTAYRQGSFASIAQFELRGILGYSITHGKNSKSYHHALGDCRLAGATSLPLHCIIKQVLEQIQGVY